MKAGQVAFLSDHGGQRIGAVAVAYFNRYAGAFQQLQYRIHGKAMAGIHAHRLQFTFYRFAEFDFQFRSQAVEGRR